MLHKHRHGGLWDNLQADKQQDKHVSIVNIAHFTKLPFAHEIIASGGFRGGMKKINEDVKGRNVIAKFSKWSPIFGEDDIKRIRDTLGAAIQPFLAELSDQFHGDGKDQDDEAGSDLDTENGGDQDNAEGGDQNDNNNNNLLISSAQVSTIRFSNARYNIALQMRVMTSIRKAANRTMKKMMKTMMVMIKTIIKMT